MQDGSWIKVDADRCVNLAAIAFIEEADDATTLYAGGPGPPGTEVRVTDKDTRRQIHSFVEQHAAKQLASGTAAARY